MPGEVAFDPLDPSPRNLKDFGGIEQQRIAEHKWLTAGALAAINNITFGEPTGTQIETATGT